MLECSAPLHCHPPRSTLSRVVAPDRVLCMGQIERNCVLMLNRITLNRTVLISKLHIYAKLNCLKKNCFHIQTVLKLNWIFRYRTVLTFIYVWTKTILILNWIVWIKTVWLNWIAWNRNVFFIIKLCIYIKTEYF